MSSALALASAACFGIGDFLGGLSSRRLPVWVVAAGSQVAGLPLLALGFLVVPVVAITPGDIVNGAIGGVAGLVGLALLYGALADGTMSVVAPITGVTAAAVPVVVDVVFGTVLDGRQWLGIGVALVAILLLAGPGRPAISPALAARALAAGLAFAAFFVAWSRTSLDSGLTPLVAARVASVPIALVLGWRAARGSRPGGRVVWLVVAAGVLDMGANMALTLALQRGSLGVVSVLSSLYPAVTALAAILVLGERPGRFEAVGIGLAVVAAALLT